MEHCTIWIRVLDTVKIGAEYLDSFEIWCLRRIEEIKCSEKVTNEEVLERIREKNTLLNNVLKPIALVTF
jgi:hypothetical protein